MLRKLLHMLKEPDQFFESVRGEGYGEPLFFLLQVSAVIAFFTPIANWLGWPSTDHNSAYQAQIIAWRITSDQLLPRFGVLAYVMEVFLILILAIMLAVFVSAFLHLIFRLLGGEGSSLNAWKAVCYGVGPCVLLGWVLYWALFMGAWSFVLQLYYGPKVLYRVREGRALLILAFFVGATLLELAMKGTTVGF